MVGPLPRLGAVAAAQAKRIPVKRTAVARVQVAWKRALIWAVAYVLVVFLLTEAIATLSERMGWAAPLIVLLGLALLVPGSLGLWLWRRRSVMPH